MLLPDLKELPSLRHALNHTIKSAANGELDTVERAADHMIALILGDEANQFLAARLLSTRARIDFINDGPSSYLFVSKFNDCELTIKLLVICNKKSADETKWSIRVTQDGNLVGEFAVFFDHNGKVTYGEKEDRVLDEEGFWVVAGEWLKSLDLPNGKIRVWAEKCSDNYPTAGKPLAFV